jgi:hypothetical protein
MGESLVDKWDQSNEKGGATWPRLGSPRGTQVLVKVSYAKMVEFIGFKLVTFGGVKHLRTTG